MIDGLTGSGKSTVIKAVHDWALARGQKIFRMQDYKQIEPPKFEDFNDFDVYFTYEPTRTWIGSAIRYELSRKDIPYGGEELVHAFALDRQIMYQRLIIPALSAGKTIIQDRGISSSIVYQPVMKNSVSLENILSLPGNKLALEHAPDALIIAKVSAHTALERIHNRDDESKGVYEDIQFLKQQEERFASQWFRDIFTSCGTRVFDLDTSCSLEESQMAATELINQILTKK